MPRKRRVVKARQTITLSTFSLSERLAFMAGFRPGGLPQWRRWATWEQFCDDYEAVRVEMLERQRGAPMFAEFVWQAAQDGTDREHAIEAYKRAKDAWRDEWQRRRVHAS